MKFLKAFNNSAALVEDDGTEKIVLGKGIGFGFMLINRKLNAVL